MSEERQAPPASGTSEKANRVPPLQILLVEDEVVLARNVQRALESEGHTVEWVESGEAGLAWARGARPDLVLLDNRLPGITGIETLQALREIDPTIIVIMMTAFATLEDAVAAMRFGAADFVRKPVGLAELELAIERVIEKDRLQQELRFYRHKRNGRDLRGVIGHSSAIQEVRRTVERLGTLPRSAANAPTVLLIGETGTGKGLLARTLHGASARREGPFIDLNCTAIPESLLEAELFGYEKGAFTDARATKPGLVEAAEGGTLFLDEIGHAGPSVQAKLLKVIEEKTVRRLGSVRDRQADLWVIAATNRDLGAAVERAEFREDLYHRLRVVEIRVPALREREDDVLELAEHFLAIHATRYGVPAPEIGEAARSALRAYRWPGNVRELANVMERAVLLAEGGVLEPKDLALLPSKNGPAASAVPAEFQVTFPPGGIVWSDLEKSLVDQALRQTGGNQVRAAKLLGLSRDALRYRMEKYGISS
jgi:two-component system, NtrC family, response regulator AtoC